LALLAGHLRRGENVIVFPEGGIAPEEGLKPFHSGAFVVATSEKVPVVIAGLHGAREALKLGTWMPHRAVITVEIGEVFLPEEIEAKSSQQLKEEAREAMEPLTGESDAGGAVRPQAHS
ncbi:MAG TPA: lysophospholipid acyltransferase family protein, partial [Noviherbaspirillum sp.]|nr:lysophospholipid acyltransferase family protein [Noviherbaspirillum sp.]